MTPANPSSSEIRSRILREAAQTFALKGYQGASVRDITSAAEANVAAVNYHFGSKADLYREVLRQALERSCFEATDESGKGRAGSREERLTALLSNIFDSFDEHQGSLLHQILAHEEAAPSGVLGPILGDLLRPRHAALVAALAKEAGCPEDHPSIHRIVKTLIDAVKGYHMDKEGVLKHLSPATFDVMNPRGAAVSSLVEQAVDMLEGAAARIKGACA